ncbi:hypothetical protein [Burkholderia seminalis]|uniref:hypothetical protein n=1 Tax=Burkholderia seminalis TaxID=488731 RepID=UPI000F59EE75|nr:hypothetical protein [Burkholderia seminalis]RQS88072.1 hypothetical protein DF048_27510 [Burkholderia seminalis]
MAKKLDMRSPFPEQNVLPLDSAGRWNRAWFEFMLKQFVRTGSEEGIDSNALKAKVDELEMLLNADTSTAIIAVLLQRVAMLEAMIMSMPAPIPARAAAANLPDPVAVSARAAVQLPEPVAPVPRATDDIRKLIEA